MIKIPLSIVLLITFCSFVSAQALTESTPPGAREAMLKFVELNNDQALKTDDARSLMTGEASEWKFTWFGAELSKPDKVVQIALNRSAARVQVVDPDLRIVDLYFYLRFENGWKVRAMRSLAQTGLIKTINAGLKNKPDLSPDEKEALANTELVLSSDKQLREWFQTNRGELKDLADLTLRETNWKPVKPPEPPKPIKMKDGSVGYALQVQPDELNDGPITVGRVWANDARYPRTAAALKRLHLAGDETWADGSVQITIGGITDNSVGFIYSPKDSPPQIDGWRYIWIEKISPGWYLFRTT